jgi:hypothetical protein
MTLDETLCKELFAAGGMSIGRKLPSWKKLKYLAADDDTLGPWDWGYVNATANINLEAFTCDPSIALSVQLYCREIQNEAVHGFDDSIIAYLTDPFMFAAAQAAKKRAP